MLLNMRTPKNDNKRLGLSTIAGVTSAVAYALTDAAMGKQPSPAVGLLIAVFMAAAYFACLYKIKCKK